MIETIVYHKDCPDGWCAAFIAQKKYPKAVLVPATHGENLNTIMVNRLFRGRHVLVVDFSWRRETTEHIHALTCQALADYHTPGSLTILDHHKTAEAELAGLPYCTFDMNRSGAQLAWDYCNEFAQYPRPWYVDYVADRDLWKFQLIDSKLVNAYIMTLPYTIEAWNALDHITPGDCASLGRGALAMVKHYVEKVAAQAYSGTWTQSPAGKWPEGWTYWKLSIVNAAYPNISDVGNELCMRGAEVGIGWFVRGDGQVQFSLRSIGDVIDVSLLAKMYGGGGHKNAAGFQLPLDQGLTLISGWTA